jgi:hypothetical protein
MYRRVDISAVIFKFATTMAKKRKAAKKTAKRKPAKKRKAAKRRR